MSHNQQPGSMVSQKSGQLSRIHSDGKSLGPSAIYLHIITFFDFTLLSSLVNINNALKPQK